MYAMSIIRFDSRSWAGPLSKITFNWNNCMWADIHIYIRPSKMLIRPETKTKKIEVKWKIRWRLCVKCGTIFFSLLQKEWNERNANETERGRYDELGRMKCCLFVCMCTQTKRIIYEVCSSSKQQLKYRNSRFVGFQYNKWAEGEWESERCVKESVHIYQKV